MARRIRTEAGRSRKSKVENECGERMKPVRVEVNDRMQTGYVYYRTKPMGREFRPGFVPDLTPAPLLELGVFGGKYMTDCREEFPASWFKRAKISEERQQASLNCFGVNASQALEVWRM